jgi:hypothetical protein
MRHRERTEVTVFTTETRSRKTVEDARRLSNCRLLGRRPQAGVGVMRRTGIANTQRTTRVLAIPVPRITPTARSAVQAVSIYCRLNDEQCERECSVTASVRLRALRGSVVKTVTSVRSENSSPTRGRQPVREQHGVNEA